MDQRREMRAADSDRDAAVARLQAAMNEGRLTLHEYDDRLARAYQAVTYGDIADLFVDLPPTTLGTVVKPEPPAPVARPEPVPAPEPEPGGIIARMPTGLRVLWTIWITAVSINLMVWLLVSLSNGSPEYFWPMWVAGPWGAGLFGVTVGVTMVQRGRRARRRRRQRRRPRDL